MNLDRKKLRQLRITLTSNVIPTIQLGLEMIKIQRRSKSLGFKKKGNKANKGSPSTSPTNVIMIQYRCELSIDGLRRHISQAR